MNPSNSYVSQRQDPLRDHYRTHPQDAWTTDHSSARYSPSTDPFHGILAIGDSRSPLATGIHRTFGGDHDAPNPGDILCAALAVCLSSTIRMVANRVGLPILDLVVDAAAEVDARGALVVDPSVPVGFQKFTVTVSVAVPSVVDEAQMSSLRERAEHCCVVLQTLRGGTELKTEWDVSRRAIAAV